MREIYRPGKPLRSGTQCMLVVPKIRTKGYGGQKFSYAAAILWNDLHSIDLKRVEIENLPFQTVLLLEYKIVCYSICIGLSAQKT